MAERTALVLGVTGMIGYPLTAALLADGWTVYGAARFRGRQPMEELVPSGCQPIRFDVTQGDPEELPNVDVLFLEIWDSTKPDQVWEINYHGVGRVVERYAGVADIVNGSTINVYGDQPTPPSEDEPCRPTSEYGRSRFALEKLIDNFCVRGGKKGIHVRYAHANSAERGVICSMAESILTDVSLGSYPDSYIQVIALEDFVRVTKAAVSHAQRPPTAVNCCHPEVWTRRKLAETIHKRLGRGRVIFDHPTGGVEHSVYADTSRMLAWFGKPQISIETLLDRALAGFIL